MPALSCHGAADDSRPLSRPVYPVRSACLAEPAGRQRFAADSAGAGVWPFASPPAPSSEKLYRPQSAAVATADAGPVYKAAGAARRGRRPGAMAGAEPAPRTTAAAWRIALPGRQPGKTRQPRTARLASTAATAWPGQPDLRRAEPANRGTRVAGGRYRSAAPSLLLAFTFNGRCTGRRLALRRRRLGGVQT